MHRLNLKHIQEVIGVTDELHTLELILTKARNSDLISQSLYTQLRMDVRNRVRELRTCDELRKQQYEASRAMFASNTAPNTGFTAIKNLNDVSPFRGKIVTYKASSYYYADGGEINHPTDNAVHFAKINITGDDMDPFMHPHAGCSRHALVDEWIIKDQTLAMRLATIEELEFLRNAQELEQGEFNYRNTKQGLEWIQAAIDSTVPARSVTVSRSDLFFFRPNELPTATPVMPQCVPMPEPFSISTTEIVDWNSQNENKDRAKEAKPSKVYLIVGGTKDEREAKSNDLMHQECMLMSSSYSSANEDELAVVFAYDFDDFALMNFNTAKSFAGTQQLGQQFSTSTFSNTARFGVINLGPVVLEEDEMTSQSTCVIS